MMQPTKPNGFWGRLLALTVWDDSYLLEDTPPRFRGIYTVVLPFTYGLFMLFGYLGTIARVPSIDKFVSGDYGDIWTPMLALTATLTFCGLVFRFHWLELIATVLLVVGLASYPISVAGIAIFENDLNRWALAGVLPVFLLLCSWRVIDLIRLIRKTRKA